MENRVQHTNCSNIAFYSIYNEELALKFDCVEGSNVAHKFPIHIHDSLCIGLITKGQRRINWVDRSDIVKQDDFFIINQNQPHAIDQISSHDYIVITIKGDWNCAIFKNIFNSKECLDLFLQLFYALKNNDINSISEKWKSLYKHLLDTCKLSDPLTSNEKFLRKALEYIHNNYQQQVSVEEIATHSCMSIYHFCRQFKQLTGLSPHNYLRQYRISQSYKHLQNNTPVFDTAIETGFYDSSHFIKTFHAYMAVSPKEYQESVIK